MRNKILIAAIKSRRARSFSSVCLDRLLKGANLRGADLRGADLSGANLKGADLRGADLRDVYLRWARLKCADLRGVDLIDADLRGADLSDAMLSGARGIKCAACHWSDHGESGRQLLGVIINREIRLFCGCFNGDKEDLIRYIANGKEQHKKSRTRAMEFVCARLEEMNTLKGGRDAQI